MSLDANNEGLDDESSMADIRKMQEFLIKCGLPKEYKVTDIDSESLPVLYKLSMDSSDPAVVGRRAKSEENSVPPEQSTSGIMSTSDGDQKDKSVLESSSVSCDERKSVPNNDDGGLKQKSLSSLMTATDMNTLQAPMKQGIKSLHKHVDVISQEADIATQEIYQHLVKHSPSPQKTSGVSRSLMVDEEDEGTGTDTSADGGSLDKKTGDTSVELESLEPWQKLLFEKLFEKLDHQKEAIEDCRNRIDAVGHIAANIAHNQNFGPWAPNHHDHPHQEETDGTQLWPSPPHQHQRQAHQDLFNQSHDGTTNNDPPEEATETDNDADGFLIPFEILENFIDGLWFFPRKVNAFLTRSRPFRLLRLIYSEAENYRIPGRCDWQSSIFECPLDNETSVPPCFLQCSNCESKPSGT